MSTLTLNLFENAVDSLDEALKKYQAAQEGDTKAYKFCVLHLSHFFELVFKHYVVQISPLLVYKTPSENSFTITLDSAVVVLEDNGHQFCPKFKTDLNWIKKLRNSIEHHTFDMDLSQVNDTIGRLVKAFDSEQERLGRLDFSSVITVERLKLFFDLADNYEQKLKTVESHVHDLYVAAQDGERQKFWDDSLFPTLYCHECGHFLAIENEQSDSGFKCAFCGCEDVDEDDLPANCIVCGVDCLSGELTGGHCYYCCGQYHMDKND